jgi:hypothetical protein
MGSLVIGAAIAVAALGGGVRTGSTGSTRAVRSRMYVVRPGDTLWRIASGMVGARGDPRPVVDRLIRINHVRGGVIVPGQRLALP